MIIQETIEICKSASVESGHKPSSVVISASLQLILDLLSQIEAISENYGQKIWPATAQKNCKPQIEIRVIVKDDVPAEE